jgi:hypothetical protein
MVEQKIDLFPVKVPDGYDMMQMLPSRSFVRLFVVPVLITYLLNRIGSERLLKIQKDYIHVFL